MTYDVMTYNGEFQQLKIHLAVLNSYVDRFIIVEANKTFTGLNKQLYFSRQQQMLGDFWHKIDYYIVSEWDDPELWALAVNSPNTKGASHWKREFYVKESIHKALKQYGVKDDDTVIIGDVDEIIDPTASFASESPIKAKLRVYSYWLNNRSDEVFYGPLVAQYKDVKDQCLNHMRSDASLYSTGDYLGWHFTNMGGETEVRRKLDHSYTQESYNTRDVQTQLSDRMKENKDYLGRSFNFTLDETEWPEYLKVNREKFKLMLK